LRLPRAPRRRIVVSGRIAPSKYLLEIVDAMQRVWLQHADAELHVLGTAEARQRDYADKVFSAAGAEIGRRIHLHGAAFDAPQRLPEFDLALVVGRHQGCPNTVLEALAAGLPVVANDSGGTRELVIDGRTGILLPDREPATIAAGLLRVMTDAKLGDSLARNGRSHVERRFSMRAMTAEYQRLLFR
jgi:glycosyltransferase involved in cell wall biosynthesis